MKNDAVIQLLSKPEGEWTRDELRDAFLTLAVKHKNAMTGWGEALDACAELQDELMSADERIAFLRRTIELNRLIQEASQPKERGRPQKNNDLSFLTEWEKVAKAEFGNMTDKKLITDYFKKRMSEGGLRQGRADSAAFQVKADSMRKLLVKARKQFSNLS